MRGVTVDTYRITDRESLSILLMKKGVRYGRFVVDIENMDDDKAKKFENNLNKFHASCGCNMGQYFLIATLVLYAAYLFMTGQPVNNWRIIIQGFMILLAATVLGKFLGKLMDGYQFKKTINNLYQELS